MRWFLALSTLLAPSVAAAHIHLTYPKARTDSPTGDQKAQHCGTVGWNRAENPDRNNTFAPGSTITVTWDETIQHPGYFRISFQQNGEDFGIPPASTGTCGQPCPAGVTDCNFPTVNQEGPDAMNGSIVLKDRIPDGMLSAEITFPDIECTNCTLQFTQVMTDKCPYTVDVNSDDIYFNCADITLTRGAPDAGTGGGGGGGGGDDAGVGGGGGNNNGSGNLEGGCSSSGAAGGLPLALGFVGLAFRRRRR